MKTTSKNLRTVAMLLVFAQAILLCAAALVLPMSANTTNVTYDVWDGTVNVEWLQDATEAAKTTHEIDTAAKLAGLAKLTNDAAIGGSTGAYEGHTFYITKNIDLAKLPWTPIGVEYGKNFAGHIEGKLNGESGSPIIKNMKIDTSIPNAGFVGTHRGGSMKNLIFTDALVTGTQSVGVAAGYISKTITAYENLVAINCELIGTINVGGLIGDIKTGGEMTFSKLAFIGGSVFGTQYVGGIVGKLEQQNYTFDTCYASPFVFSASQGNGGLIGLISDANTMVKLSNCHFDGMVRGMAANDSGAFIGIAPAGMLMFEKCLSTGISLAGGVSTWVGKADSAAVVSRSKCFANSNMAVSTAITPTTLQFSALSGEAAKTSMTDFDFTAVWATRSDMIPVLAFVKDLIPTTYGKADLTWFDPAQTSFAIENENQLIGMAVLSYVTTGDAYTIAVASSLTNLLTEELFDADFLSMFQNAAEEESSDESSEESSDNESDSVESTVESENTDDETVPEEKTETEKADASTAEKSTEKNDQNDKTDKESGCASAVGGVVVILTAFGAAVAAVARKRED